MHAPAQIDLRDFPYRTPGTEDLELIAVFVGPDELPIDVPRPERDYPCREDVAEDCPDEFDDDYLDLFPNADGSKFGGWPSLIQAEIRWGGACARAIRPEHVFQIDSTDRGDWGWGDRGVGHFGRGTASGRTDRWALDWQCY